MHCHYFLNISFKYILHSSWITCGEGNCLWFAFSNRKKKVTINFLFITTILLWNNYKYILNNIHWIVITLYIYSIYIYIIYIYTHIFIYVCMHIHTVTDPYFFGETETLFFVLWMSFRKFIYSRKNFVWL